MSARGVDVALCLQYNDRIVFDCVTSTRQNPICLPIEKHEQEVEWEQLDICKLGKMERVFMQQDTYGALYFIMRYDGGKCTILRQNPDAEMGDVEFITKVFEFRSELLYFFLYNESNNKFYIMD